MVDANSGFFVQAAYNMVQQPQELKLLYEGPNAMIWRGNRDGRFRIFKCLCPEHRGDATHELMLRKEFEIVYNLQHPNICNFFSFTTLPNLGNCIEMEWIDGCTLAELAADGPITDRVLCRQIISEICDALSYIHAKHVVHRDLKPSNILVSHLGKHVTLIDFGLSDSESHSILKSPGGTQFFAAPELVAGLEPDWRSDIFSLGRTIAVTMKPFGDVARKCCRSDRKKRYQSALAVKEALGRRSRWKTAGIVAAASAAVVGIIMACVLMLNTSNENPSEKGIPTSQTPTASSETSFQQPVTMTQEVKAKQEVSTAQEIAVSTTTHNTMLEPDSAEMDYSVAKATKATQPVGAKKDKSPKCQTKLFSLLMLRMPNLNKIPIL